MPTPAPAEGDAATAKLGVWKQALYDRCRESGTDMFSQDDLLRLDVIPNRDLMLLARVVQSLTDDKLFITMREASGQVLWKWRDSEEAHKCVEKPLEQYIKLIADNWLGISSARPTNRSWFTLLSTTRAATVSGRRRYRSD